MAGEKLDPGVTLVVLDPRVMRRSEARAIGAFVRAGGRLVAGGLTGSGWIEDGLGGAPEPRGDGARTSRALVPVPETAGVTDVEDPEAAAWEEPGAALPIAGRGGGAARRRRAQGPRPRAAAGQRRAAAEPRARARGQRRLRRSPPPGRATAPVVFLETVHGYGEATGLGGPAGAHLVDAARAAARRARVRLEPRAPDRAAGGRGAPAPARRAGSTSTRWPGALARTRRPAEVARPLREAARERLAARAGLPPGAGDDELRAAGERFGLDEDEVRALVTAPVDRDGALAAGRAYSKLEGVRA